MKTYKIHLIRQGLTDANLKGMYIGQKTDMPLCPEGVKMLLDMKTNNDYPYIEALYSSPLKRCTQTASVLYPNKPIVVVDQFTEYDFGDFDGKTANELENNENFRKWTSGEITAVPNGEDNKQFIERLAIGLNLVVNDMIDNGKRSSAIVMHGGAIMMLLSSCAVPRRHTAEWVCEAGGGYSILITPSLYHSSGIVEVIGEI